MTTSSPTQAADPQMPDILGLYETHLTVSNLQRSIGFYRDILKLEVATIIENRNVAFLWIDDKRMGMLGLWETGSAPLRMRLHIAFRTTLEDVLGSAADPGFGVKPYSQWLTRPKPAA